MLVCCPVLSFACIAPDIDLVNKQLNDKERVAAALENPALLEVLEQCLSTVGRDVDAIDT